MIFLLFINLQDLKKIQQLTNSLSEEIKSGACVHGKKLSFTFSKSSSFSLSFSPSLASLYLFEQCLRLGVIGTSSVCLPLQD